MRENKRHEIEVHVAPLSFRQVGEKLEVLIAKRSPTRDFFPNKWECGGGQVHPKENFEQAAKRQLREEFGLEIEIIAPFGTYEIDAPNLGQKKVPGVIFACKWIKGEPAPTSDEHVECQWVSVEKLDSLDFIPGLRSDILKGAELFRAYTNDGK